MGKSEYIIQFGGLTVGIHEYEFEVNDKFFRKIEESEVKSSEPTEIFLLPSSSAVASPF